MQGQGGVPSVGVGSAAVVVVVDWSVGGLGPQLNPTTQGMIITIGGLLVGWLLGVIDYGVTVQWVSVVLSYQSNQFIL